MARQEAVIDRLTRRIETSGLLEGALLIGSLARGEGDEVSDVDLIVVVADGQFSQAWAARRALEGGEAVVPRSDGLERCPIDGAVRTSRGRSGIAWPARAPAAVHTRRTRRLRSGPGRCRSDPRDRDRIRATRASRALRTRTALGDLRGGAREVGPASLEPHLEVAAREVDEHVALDRKSTRLNSSH